MAELSFKFSAFFTIIVLEVSLVLIFFTGRDMNWATIFKNLDPKCDVINSSVIRKLVEKNWTPVLKRYGVSLPIECPFNLSRDMLGVREQLKQRRSSHWKCRKCGKRFYLEKYLDLHIQKRHPEIIRKADDSICLGNYCDVMRCDMLKSIHASHDDFTSTDVSVWTPSSSSLSNEVRGDGKEKQKYIESTTTPKIGLPHKEGGGGGPIPKSEFQIRDECDEEYFAQLRFKCSQIIWDCIQGLISILDAQDFRTIQDELELSSCSYLTCSRFDDTNCSQYSKYRGTMRPFLLVFGSLLISLCLALAYYFAWIYTQSSEEPLPRYNSNSPKGAKFFEDNSQFPKSASNSPAIVQRTSHI